MKKQLTETQQGIIDVIRETWKKDKHSPLQGEIANWLGVSQDCVYENIRALVKMKVLKKDKKLRIRNIKLA